jgi:hypothetical protein
MAKDFGKEQGRVDPGPDQSNAWYGYIIRTVGPSIHGVM